MIDSLVLCSDIRLNAFENIIRENLQNNISYLKDETILSGNHEKKHFFEIYFKHYIDEKILADLLCKWIIQYYEPYLIEKIFYSEFPENSGDKSIILKKFFEKKRNLENYKYIVKKLTKYFKTYSNIIIRGFVQFRLTEYMEGLYADLYEAIEDYYIEKEYEEFLELLKEYIDVKPSLIDLVHINTDSDGNYVFFDFKMNKINVEIEDEASLNLFKNFFTRDDILLSFLIALTPKRIIWHKTQNLRNGNILNTVKAIFKNRVSVCTNCSECDKLFKNDD